MYISNAAKKGSQLPYIDVEERLRRLRESDLQRRIALCYLLNFDREGLEDEVDDIVRRKRGELVVPKLLQALVNFFGYYADFSELAEMELEHLQNTLDAEIGKRMRTYYAEDTLGFTDMGISIEADDITAGGQPVRTMEYGNIKKVSHILSTRIEIGKNPNVDKLTDKPWRDTH